MAGYMARYMGILMLLFVVNPGGSATASRRPASLTRPVDAAMTNVPAQPHYHSARPGETRRGLSRAGMQAQAPVEKQFSPEEMIEDINTMIRTFEDVHPDLYCYTSKTEIDALKSELIRSLTRPLVEREFVQVVARLAAKFGDGHTSVSLALPSRRTYVDNGGLIFPIDIKRTAGGVLVRRNYSDNSTLAPGDRIIAINGVDVDQLFAQLLDEVSGEELAYRTVEVEGAFKPMLWIHGIMPPFRIDFQSKQAGQRKTETVQGLAAQVLTGRQRAAAGGLPTGPYQYETLAPGIGYLNFRSMGGDMAAFEAFLDITFKRIRADKAKGLIVDLRENGGGNSALGESLLSYVTNKPYKMSDRKEWKASRQYREFIKSNIRFFPYAKYLEAKDGEIVVFKDEMIRPKDNALRFDGPVCFLIGRRTFSSAMMVANAVGDFKLATLIGEETGDPPTSFGELYFFNLPHSKLAINVSTAHFVRANGDAADKHPVLPDIRVTPTQGDLERQVDAVLEFAKKWILQRDSKPVTDLKR